MKPGLRTVIISAGLVSLAACAPPTSWVHPTLPEDRWSLDASTCRAQANRLIERELGRRGYSSDRHVTELERNLQQFDAKKRRTKLFENCLSRRGYVKSKPAAKKMERS